MSKQLSEKIKKKLESKDWLYRQYIILKKSSREIAKMLGISKQSVLKQINLFNLKKDKNSLLKERQRKIEKTNLKKYGVKNTGLVKEFQEKKKQTCLKKYNAKSPLESSIIRQKIKSTNLEKYGVDNPILLEKTHKKIKNTNLEKYGVEYPLQSKKIRKKIKNTNLKKYGLENILSDPKIREKAKKTLKEKYAVEFPLQSKIIKEKMKNTLLHRYNVNHPMYFNDFKEKLKNTNLKRYGVNNTFKRKDIKEKMIKNNLEKYGKKYIVETEEFKEKSKQTMLNKYGFEHALQNKDFKEKFKQTSLEKYGVEYPIQSKEIQNKIKQTCLEKYGVEYPIQSKEIQNKMYQTKKERGTFNTSKPEEDIHQFLLDMYPDFTIKRQYSEDKRYPFACDFYIKELDFFIELQGSWTHGKEPYDNINIPKNWTEKAKTSEYYKNAVKVYTQKDPEKRKAALENNLNYLEIWYSDLLLGPEWISFLLLNQGLPLKYSNKSLINEYNKIVKIKGDFKRNPNQNKIIEHFQPHFYKKERELWNNSKIRNRLVENRIKYKNEDIFEITPKQFLQGFKISGIHIGYSFFSPLWIKAFIEKYNINSIYDPCMGWGHRLLGSKDITYIGNDLCKETYKGNIEIAKYFEMKDKYFYNQPAEDFIPEQDYEAVFTCPPYFNTEIYSGKNTSTSKYSEYQDWLNVWWRKVIQNSLKESTKYFAFIINNKYKQDMLNICIQEGLNLIEEISVGKNNLNHFQRVSKKSSKGEFLLVFKI